MYIHNIELLLAFLCIFLLRHAEFDKDRMATTVYDNLVLELMVTLAHTHTHTYTGGGEGGVIMS